MAVALVCSSCGGAATTTRSRRVAVHESPHAHSAADGAPHLTSAVARGSGAARPVDRKLFASGACMAFPPTAGDRHLTVFLDAGHGGIDPGAVGRTSSGRTVYEARVTLPVELDTMAILRRRGFRVVVSRTRNTSVIRLRPGDISGGILTAQASHDDVAARDVCANDAHADALVGIYFNAGAPSSAGCLTAYDALRPFAPQSLRLARLLQRDVLAALNANGWGIPDDGVRTDVGLGSTISAQAAAYGHLMLLGPAKAGYLRTPSRMLGALIEPLFITDPFEGSIAVSQRGQHAIARGLAKAITQFFAAAR